MYNVGDRVYIFKGEYENYYGIIDEVFSNNIPPIIYTVIVEDIEIPKDINDYSSLKITQKKLCLTEKDIVKVNIREKRNKDV